MVVNTLKNEEGSFASFGHLLASIQPTIDVFNNIFFSHTRRLGNFVVYNLVKHARHINGFFFFFLNERCSSTLA